MSTITRLIGGVLSRLKGSRPPESSVISEGSVSFTERQPVTDVQTHNHEEMRRFRTTVVGDLAEPSLPYLAMGTAWLSVALSALAVWWLVFPVAGIAVGLAVAFLFGIRRVPTVHCALLYTLGRRSEIGYWEGFVWVPWFLAGTLKVFNAERFFYNMPRRDNWTSDVMHITYDVRFRFSVAPPTKRPLWINFFWWWHAAFETETYEEVCEARGADFGRELFIFMQNPDVENAMRMAESHAESITRQILRRSRFVDIFNFPDLTSLETPVAVNLAEHKTTKAHRLEEEIRQQLNLLMAELGLFVTDLALADVEFDAEASAALQQRQLAPILAATERLAYEQRIELARKLMLDPQIGEAALKAEIIRSLQTAAQSGILGTVLQGTALSKVLGLSELPQPLITSAAA